VHILIVGAAGMVGRKLTQALVARGEVGGRSIEQLTLADVVRPEAPKFGGKVETMAADLSASGAAASLIGKRPDLIFHLAAIVSGEAESDFENGYRVNLDGTRRLIEAVYKRGEGYKPKVVFTSSIAVFGAPKKVSSLRPQPPPPWRPR